MSNNLLFSQTQINEIQTNLDLYIQEYPNNDSALVSPILEEIYVQINGWIEETLVEDPTAVDEDTRLFFRLALEVNQNVAGPANTFIRTATVKKGSGLYTCMKMLLQSFGDRAGTARKLLESGHQMAHG